MERTGVRGERRAAPLTKGRIVGEAIHVLDEGGADALTFRTLAARLATGPGALYHHIAGKGDLLALATNDVLVEALDRSAADEPDAGVRTVMLAAFDTLGAHPWVGSLLATAPWQPAVLTLFDRVGSRLAAAGVPEAALFDCASVLVHHVLGVAGQYDGATRPAEPPDGRATFIATATTRALAAGGGDHPFLRTMESRLARHDDREQFTAGVEIILAGVAVLSRASGSGTAGSAGDAGQRIAPWTR